MFSDDERFERWTQHQLVVYFTVGGRGRNRGGGTEPLIFRSPRAYLHVVGMLQLMSFDKNQLSSSVPCHSALGVCFCVCGPFNCISFNKFFGQLSAFSLNSSGLIFALLGLSAIYLFLKVSLNGQIGVLCET